MLFATAATAQKRESPARADVEKLIAESGAEVGVAFRTLDGKQELFLNADTAMHAASTMKVAVMIEVFRQEKAGKLKLDDLLPVRNEFPSAVDGSAYVLDVGDDSDAEVYRRAGRTMSLRELCEAMITVSSNLATNLLLEKLGVENIRRTVRRLGANGLEVRRGVQDLKAFDAGMNNTTTARALLILLEKIAKGKAVSREASAEMVEILERQKFRDDIPAGLPPGLRVAHKTGTITRIRHDAAIVFGERPYVLVVLVRGIEESKRASALIAAITHTIHSSLEEKTTTPQP